MNNKVHTVIKISSLIANYRRELKIGMDIRRKQKMKKATEFARKNEKCIKRSRGSIEESIRGNKEASRQRIKRDRKNKKNRDKVILSTKDLVFKERLVKNLIERYMESYVVEKVILKNLKLLVSMRIHPVVIVSRILYIGNQ